MAISTSPQTNTVLSASLDIIHNAHQRGRKGVSLLKAIKISTTNGSNDKATQQDVSKEALALLKSYGICETASLSPDSIPNVGVMLPLPYEPRKSHSSEGIYFGSPTINTSRSCEDAKRHNTRVNHSDFTETSQLAENKSSSENKLIKPKLSKLTNLFRRARGQSAANLTS
jgi:hypothetical protein